MIAFALRVFSAIVLFLLATEWVIHDKADQWLYGALAAFVVSFILNDERVVKHVA